MDIKKELAYYSKKKKQDFAKIAPNIKKYTDFTIIDNYLAFFKGGELLLKATFQILGIWNKQGGGTWIWGNKLFFVDTNTTNRIQKCVDEFTNDIIKNYDEYLKHNDETYIQKIQHLLNGGNYSKQIISWEEACKLSSMLNYICKGEFVYLIDESSEIKIFVLVLKIIEV